MSRLSQTGNGLLMDLIKNVLSSLLYRAVGHKAYPAAKLTSGYAQNDLKNGWVNFVPSQNTIYGHGKRKVQRKKRTVRRTRK